MATKHPIEDFVSNPAAADFKVPELPNLGELIKAKGFAPGMAEFGEKLTRWRSDLERALVERLKLLSIPELGSEEEDAAGTVVTAAVQATTAQLIALASQVQTLISDLAEHIAATVVHGTVSDVVGETDEQALDAKTIGMASPRQAKFLHSITRNTLPTGQSLLIPSGYNVIVAGPFIVDGLMTIDGYFASV